MKIKKNSVYYADNSDLGLPYKGGHSVVVTDVSPDGKECEVKTITSLEHRYGGFNHYDYKALGMAKAGKIIPIPLKELNSRHYSGVYQKPVHLKSSLLKKDTIGFHYPWKYHSLIKK